MALLVLLLTANGKDKGKCICTLGPDSAAAADATDAAADAGDDAGTGTVAAAATDDAAVDVAAATTVVSFISLPFFLFYALPS